MTGIILYSLAALLVAASFAKDRRKTLAALGQSWRQLKSLTPLVLAILLMVGLTLAILRPEAVSDLLGRDSGPLGVALGLLLGSVAFMPSFVAFPLGATLLEHGAGYPQVAAFLASLMGVGITTLPLEAKYFGLRVTVMRNLLCLVTACAVVAVIYLVLP